MSLDSNTKGQTEKPYQAKPQGFLSMAEAAKITGYHQDYLSALARSGKLAGHKIGRNWVTTKSAVDNLLAEVTGVEIIRENHPALDAGSDHSQTPASAGVGGADQLALPAQKKTFSLAPLSPQKLLVSVFMFIIFFPVIANLTNLSDKLALIQDKMGRITAATQGKIDQRLQNYLKKQLLALGILNQESGIKNQEPVSHDSRFAIHDSRPEGQIAGIEISSDDIVVALREVLTSGTLPEDIKLSLKGEKGDRGEMGLQGQTGPQATTVQYIPNSGSVFGTTAPTAQPSNAGTIGSATYLSSKEFYTDKLTVTGTSTLTSLSISGNSTVSGDLTVSGTSTLNGLVITNSLLTSNAQSTFTKVPTLAHVFTPSWPLGTSNASDGTVYINPASSIADGNLLSAAVGGSIKFLVDSEGDIYGNNLILTGSTSQGATTIAGNLTVQDSTTLGDAASDTINFVGVASSNLTFKKADPTIVFDVTTATDTDYWAGAIDDADGVDDDLFQIGKGTTPGTTPYLTIRQDGNVGIGTTDPLATFHVGPGGARIQASVAAGTNYASRGTLLTLTRYDLPTSYLTKITGSWSGSSNADNALYFEIPDTNGTTGTIMTMNGAGNVGIGTTNPGSKLDVLGSVRFDGTTSDWTWDAAGGLTPGYLTAAFNINGQPLTNASFISFITNPATAGTIRLPNTGDIQWRNAANGANVVGVAFGTDNNLQLMPNGGNVGIGTTNPSTSRLVVSQAADEVNLRLSGAGNLNGFDFTRITATGALSIQGNQTGANNIALAPTSGNVGIGTTGPGKPLHIRAGDGILRLEGTNVGSKIWDLGTGLAANASFTIRDATAVVDRFVINTDGNIGIGTTSPSALLSVKGTLSSALTGTVSVTINTAAVTGVGTAFTTELAVGDSIKIGSEIFTVSAITSATALTLDSNHLTGASGVTAFRDPTLLAIDNGDAVNKLTMTRSGNVGIGTTGPNAKLMVTGSDSLNTSFGLRVDGATGTGLYVTNANNVGIGTTGPGASLDVQGANGFKVGTEAWPTSLLGQSAGRLTIAQAGGNATLVLHDNTAVAANTGPSGIYFTGRSNDTGPAYSYFAQIVGLKENATQNNSAAYLAFKTAPSGVSGTSVTEKMRITSDGNVGIGTTGPAAKLQIEKDSTYNNELAGGIYIRSGGSGTKGLLLGADNTNSVSYVQASTIGTTFISNLALNPNGGNVGIGTTAPGALLHVYTNTSGGNTLAEIFNDNAGAGSTAQLRVISDGGSAMATFRADGNVDANLWSIGQKTGSTDFQFVGAQTLAADTALMSIQQSGNVVITGNCSDAAGGGGCTADYAEVYETEPGSGVSQGDLLAFNSNGKIVRSTEATGAVGIYSTTPGLLIGHKKGINIGSGSGTADVLDANEVPVALVGRVPVKISEENGPIQAGDRLTVSSILPGYAAKMTESGQSIGIALESLTGSDSKILAFINLGYQKIDVAQSTDGQLIADESADYNMNGFSILNVKAITSIGGLWSISEDGVLVAEKIQTKIVEVDEGITLKDKVNGSYYCVYFENGAMLNKSGKCDEVEQESGIMNPESGSSESEISASAGVGEEPPPATEPVEEPTPEEPAVEPSPPATEELPPAESVPEPEPTP